MPGEYDSLLKETLLRDPVALLRFVGIDASGVITSENTDLSASSRQADILLKVHSLDLLVHLELQMSYDARMALRMLEYRVLSCMKEAFLSRMRSIVILLREKADGPGLTGVLESDDLRFTYDVIRLWKQDAELVFSLPVHFWPLALLCNVSIESLAVVVRRIEAGISGEYSGEVDRREILSGVHLLLGLRVGRAVAEQIMEAFMIDLEESATYQAILQKGEQRGIQEGMQQGIQQGERMGSLVEARRILLRLGSLRLGEPSAEAALLLESIEDASVLEAMIEKALSASTWQDVLG